jgi:hypothetical protein
MTSASRFQPRQRLVCVVEGHGEVRAVPHLCTRIAQHLRVERWMVDPEPIRHPKANLVTTPKDGQSPSLPRTDGIERVLRLARARPANAVLVLCDADDDCPAQWGPGAAQYIKSQGMLGGAVMIQREFESWLLCSQLGKSKAASFRRLETVRDAKGQLKKRFAGYKPSVHQLELTKTLDIDLVRTQFRLLRQTDPNAGGDLRGEVPDPSRALTPTA